MSTIVSRGRRQFLRGVRGASLALPFLPSLWRVRDAEAQAGAGTKCLAYLHLQHGGIPQTAMFPADSLLTETQMYAGHAIRRGVLQPEMVGGDVVLSQVLRAPASALTPKLLAKMNLLRGVDLPHYPGHGNAQALGNYGDITGGAIDEGKDWKRPTVDQIIAWAPGFYGAAAVRERAMVLGEISWANSNPAAGTGPLQRVAATAPSNIALFDKLFGTQTQPAGGAGAKVANTLLVDQVYENYKRLAGSGKLSMVDKKRIDDHMARLFELQRKLAQPALTLTGAPPVRPTMMTGKSDSYAVNPTAQARNWNLWTDVATAAFSVGASRILTACLTESFSTSPGDWHDVAHGPQASRAVKIVEANQRFFANVLVEFARKLDAVILGDGSTLLDSSLLAWAHESGSVSHYGTGMPITTFGSAQGFLRTGQYCDYRNMNKMMPSASKRVDDAPIEVLEASWHGLVWNQWLGSVLRTMGVPSTAYTGLAGGSGYPAGRPGDLKGYMASSVARYPGAEAPYTDAVWAAAANDVLPWLH